MNTEFEHRSTVDLIQLALIETDDFIKLEYVAILQYRGTLEVINEAKKLCPDLVCVLARHDVYVDYHHRILKEIEHVLPIDWRRLGNQRTTRHCPDQKRWFFDGLYSWGMLFLPCSALPRVNSSA